MNLAVEVVVPALAIHTDEQLPSAVITTSHSPSRRLPSRTRDTYSEPYFEDPFLTGTTPARGFGSAITHISWTDFLYPREPPDHLVPLLSASAPNVPGPDLPEPPVESPLLLKLKKVAEDASILLELFSQTLPTTEESINAEHKQIIASAAESILTLETGIRLISARQSEPIGSLREIVLDMEATKVDASCIICYAQIADTVFMPCKHLGLCGV